MHIGLLNTVVYIYLSKLCHNEVINCRKKVKLNNFGFFVSVNFHQHGHAFDWKFSSQICMQILIKGLWLYLFYFFCRISWPNLLPQLEHWNTQSTNFLVYSIHGSILRFICTYYSILLNRTQHMVSKSGMKSIHIVTSAEHQFAPLGKKELRSTF